MAGTAGVGFLDGCLASSNRGTISEDEFDLSGAILEQPSDDRPARIEVGLTNTGDRPFIVDPYRFGPFATDLRVTHRSEPARLLFGAHDFDPVRRDGCWIASTDAPIPQGTLLGSIEPGDAAREEFLLMAAPETDACLQTGTYRYTTTNRLVPGRIQNHTPETSGPPVTVEHVIDVSVNGGAFDVAVSDPTVRTPS